MAGTSKTIRSTWDPYLEMPPGTYDVEVYFRPKKLVRGQVLQAGKTTLVTTGGQGRLMVSGNHGKVTLYAPGTKREREATWESSIDVPAGKYDLRIHLPGGETERSGVIMTAGKATVVEIGGPR